MPRAMIESVQEEIKGEDDSLNLGANHSSLGIAASPMKQGEQETAEEQEAPVKVEEVEETKP